MDAMYCPKCLNIVVKREDDDSETGWFCQNCNSYLNDKPISSEKAVEIQEERNKEKIQRIKKAIEKEEQRQRQLIAYQIAKSDSRLQYAPILIVFGTFLFVVSVISPWIIPVPNQANSLELYYNVMKAMSALSPIGFILFAIGTYMGVKEAIS